MNDKVPLQTLSKKKKYNFYYDTKKRTKGGFVDAAFISSLILTAGVWILLTLVIGGKYWITTKI